jgi:putative protease
VTCNTLPRNEEIQRMPAYLEMLQDAGADALIVADLGVLSLAKRHAPRCQIHISTQLGIMNYETAQVLYDMGASRVVLARELSTDDIATIHAKTPSALELECFVHGAMCMSVSGRCMLSSYLTGRDANHGDCAQPCRWKYHLKAIVQTEGQQRNSYSSSTANSRETALESQTIPVRDLLTAGLEEDENGTFLFNANDLCMIDHVADLVKAGVSSFKIEGRAKAAYYVAVTTNAYRQAVDGYMASGCSPDYRPPAWLTEELNKVSHRPYGTGFFYGAPAQNTKSGGYIRDYEIAAVVEGWKDGRLYLSQRNRFFSGDVMSVLVPSASFSTSPFDLTMISMEDEDGQPIDSATHAMMKLSIPFDRPLAAGSLLRRKC